MGIFDIFKFEIPKNQNSKSLKLLKWQFFDLQKSAKIDFHVKSEWQQKFHICEEITLHSVETKEIYSHSFFAKNSWKQRYY